jgi:hypothetical protein
MTEEPAPRRRWTWALGYAVAVATLVALGALFLPYLRCPSCDGLGMHPKNASFGLDRDYPCLVCRGARRISGQAWIRAMAR